MTFFSNEIKDFLDKIYLYEISHWNGDGEMTPVHNYFESKLRSIDSLPTHSLSTRFPFNRDRLFVIVIGRFIFGYRYDGTNAAVDIYRKLESMGDWLDVIIPESRQPKKIVITEQKLRRIIAESIRSVLYN